MLSTELAELKAYMTDNPGAVIEDVARERKVTPRAVLEAMPETMVQFRSGGEFAAAMADIAQWGEVTLIVHTDDVGAFADVQDPLLFGGVFADGTLSEGSRNDSEKQKEGASRNSHRGVSRKR